jgi:hypothetical protein
MASTSKLKIKRKVTSSLEESPIPVDRETTHSKEESHASSNLDDSTTPVETNSQDALRQFLDEWTGRDVFVAFPSYKFTNPATAWTLAAIALDYGKERVRFDMELGDGMIYHARNRLAMKFLATDAKWMLFIDDDMIIPIGRPSFLRQMCRLPANFPDSSAGLQTIDRLLSHNRDLVGATYFGRQPSAGSVNSLSTDSRYRELAAEFRDTILPCDWVGTGCLLVSRKVFELMQERFPELAPSQSGMPWNFFQPMTDGRGEDIAFCARARECGIQPYVDTRLHVPHVGFAVYGLHTSNFNSI